MTQKSHQFNMTRFCWSTNTSHRYYLDIFCTWKFLICFINIFESRIIFDVNSKPCKLASVPVCSISLYLLQNFKICFTPFMYSLRLVIFDFIYCLYNHCNVILTIHFSRQNQQRSVSYFSIWKLSKKSIKFWIRVNRRNVTTDAFVEI